MGVVSRHYTTDPKGMKFVNCQMISTRFSDIRKHSAREACEAIGRGLPLLAASSKKDSTGQPALAIEGPNDTASVWVVCQLRQETKMK